MKDENMKKAIDDFILARINYTGQTKSIAVQEALAKLTADVEKLKSTFSNEQVQLFLNCENTFDMLIGELQNCYYRSGFSDGVAFLLDWRDTK